MTDAWNYLLKEVIKPGCARSVGAVLALHRANWNLKKNERPLLPISHQMIMSYQKLVNSPAQRGIVPTQISIRVPWRTPQQLVIGKSN